MKTPKPIRSRLKRIVREPLFKQRIVLSRKGRGSYLRKTPTTNDFWRSE